MLLKLITLLLVGCTLAITAAVVPHQKIQEDFNKFLTDSQNFAQNNPDRYQECYAYYGPIMSQVGKEYQDGVNTCSDNAKQNRTNINGDSYVIAAKSDMSNSAATLCDSLQTCEINEDAMESFQCYSTNGNDGSNISNDIKFKAVNGLEYIQNLLSNISSQETLCVNQASATYNKDWSNLSQKLQACFTSNEPLDTTTSTTTTTTTTITTTTTTPPPEPTTTTEEPST